MQRRSKNKIKGLTEAKRQELSSEWEASGVTQGEFCKLKGISRNSFVYWRSTVLQKAGKSQANFLPLSIPPSQERQVSFSGITLRLANGIILEIAETAGKAFLQEVFELLGIPSC